MRKVIMLSIMYLFAFGSLLTAQSDLKAAMNQLDLNISVSKKEDAKKVITMRYRKNKAYIKKKFNLSEKEYNSMAKKVYASMKKYDANTIKRAYRTTYQKADDKTKLSMDLARAAFLNDNPSSGDYSAYKASDILAAGAAGAAVGAGIGGGIGLAFGPGGAATGAAVGGFLGAAFGLGVGIGEEINDPPSEGGN